MLSIHILLKKVATARTFTKQGRKIKDRTIEIEILIKIFKSYGSNNRKDLASLLADGTAKRK